MAVSKKKNIFKQTFELFLKYKVACAYYLALVVIIYPIYFFINDYKTKYYNISFNYINLLPTTELSNRTTLIVLNYHKKITNEIEYQIEAVTSNKEASIICKLIDYKSTCVLKVKNWSPKKALLLQNSLLAAVTSVTEDFKYKIKQEINLLNDGINDALVTKEILRSSKEALKNNEVNMDIVIKEMDLRLNVNEYLNKKRADIVSLDNHIVNLDKFQKSFNKTLPLYFENSEMNLFENYSLNKHFLSIILGIGFLFFGLLILIG